MDRFISEEPIVKLVDWSEHPYDLGVAAARTCYSSKGIIAVEDVSKTKKAREIRDRVAQITLKAGHLTTRQHSNFIFTIDKVSRQTIWSFLHSHPFYNSEQVSQRYVEVKPENYMIPPLEPEPLEIYKSAIQTQMDGYFKLIELLIPDVGQEFYKIFPARAKKPEKWESVIKKRAYEVARYVLPVATHAYMYHTIGGLTLHRYAKLCDIFDTPLEQKIIVQKMLEEVRKVDPLFVNEIGDRIPIEETPEFKILSEFKESFSANTSAEFLAEFDAKLGGHVSKLIDYKMDNEGTLALSVRSILGVPESKLSDKEAIELLLRPEKNNYLADTINLTSIAKLTKAMVHPHYTFMKKLSHTADSQDQRHRTVPGSRPILSAHYTHQPDYIIPKLILPNAEAMELYAKVMSETFDSIERLWEMGVPAEYALYLLPNAFPIRFVESGNLMDLHHKWKMRLCYTAQEEIFYASLDEVKQVAQVNPLIGSNIKAPCWFRAKAHETPYCPEGDRFCGVAVWKIDLDEYERTI